jgi:hypothetical protein
MLLDILAETRQNCGEKRVDNAREVFPGAAGIDIPLASPWLVSPLRMIGSENGEQQKKRTMGDIGADHKARRELSWS